MSDRRILIVSLALECSEWRETKASWKNIVGVVAQECGSVSSTCRTMGITYRNMLSMKAAAPPLGDWRGAVTVVYYT